MNRREILLENAQIMDDETRRANSPDTLQEDKAFMKRMQKVRFRDFNETELKRLYRIALKGNEVRSALDSYIRDIRLHELEKIADRTINHGLKYSEIYRRLTDKLKGMR